MYHGNAIQTKLVSPFATSVAARAISIKTTTIKG
jgi:hypothetical protein